MKYEESDIFIWKDEERVGEAEVKATTVVVEEEEVMEFDWADTRCPSE